MLRIDPDVAHSCRFRLTSLFPTLTIYASRIARSLVCGVCTRHLIFCKRVDGQVKKSNLDERTCPAQRSEVTESSFELSKRIQ